MAFQKFRVHIQFLCLLLWLTVCLVHDGGHWAHTVRAASLRTRALRASTSAAAASSSSATAAAFCSAQSCGCRLARRAVACARVRCGLSAAAAVRIRRPRIRENHSSHTCTTQVTQAPLCKRCAAAQETGPLLIARCAVKTCLKIKRTCLIIDISCFCSMLLCVQFDQGFNCEGSARCDHPP